ncbi:MAG: IPT/TIG domain-containing protein [Proteobacteria bacterium]|nr:IPT/TIG domain-containing protein [Pseudomonadota bacterium]
MPSPTVISVKASIGPLAGETLVEVTGTGFSPGVVVKFDQSACSVVSFSSLRLTCTTPLHSAGAVTVTATNSDTQFGSLDNGYTYQAAPTVTSVTASSGATAGGTVVAVTGTGFLPGVGVTFGGLACTSTSGTLYFDSTWLSCWTPPHIAGAVKVTATNTDTQTGSYSSYTYQAAPTVTLVTASSGALDGGTLVTVKGAGFLSGVGVTFDGTACTTLTLTSSTELTCTTPAHSPGPVTVRATNTDGQGGSLYPGYTYQAAPTVTSVIASAGAVEGDTLVKVIGTEFLEGVKVTFGESACTTLTLTSSTELTCTTPAHDEGPVMVTATNTDTQTGSYSSYTYQAVPTVTSISPTSGPVAGDTLVTVTGTRFLSGVGVRIGGAACTLLTLKSSTSLTCTTPPGTAGAQDVVVTNSDTQFGTLPLGYTYTEEWIEPECPCVDPDDLIASENPDDEDVDLAADLGLVTPYPAPLQAFLNKLFPLANKFRFFASSLQVGEESFTLDEFDAALTGFGQLDAATKASIEFKYKWLEGRPGHVAENFFVFQFGPNIYILQKIFINTLFDGDPGAGVLGTFMQYRGWYPASIYQGAGLGYAQEWVNIKINDLNELNSPLSPGNLAEAARGAMLFFPPTIGIEKMQEGDFLLGGPLFLGGVAATLYSFATVPVKGTIALVTSVAAFSGGAAAVLYTRDSPLSSYIDPAGQLLSIFPFRWAGKLIKGRFVPAPATLPATANLVEKALINPLIRLVEPPLTGDKITDISKIIYKLFKERGANGQIPREEVTLINHMYDAIAKKVNPNNLPKWTPDIAAKYDTLFNAEMKNVATIWAIKNKAKTDFNQTPYRLDQVVGALFKDVSTSPGTPIEDIIAKKFPQLIDPLRKAVIGAVNTIPEVSTQNKTLLVRVVPFFEGKASIGPPDQGLRAFSGYLKGNSEFLKDKETKVAVYVLKPNQGTVTPVIGSGERFGQATNNWGKGCQTNEYLFHDITPVTWVPGAKPGGFVEKPKVAYHYFYHP